MTPRQTMQALIGFQVVETNALPDGSKFIISGNTIFVRRTTNLKWQILLHNTRQQIKRDLAVIVAAAENRLGLTCTTGKECRP